MNTGPEHPGDVNRVQKINKDNQTAGMVSVYTHKARGHIFKDDMERHYNDTADAYTPLQSINHFIVCNNLNLNSN